MRDWLKLKRTEAGYIQEEVAINAGIARITYAMIEQGERDPSVAVAVKIAEVLKFNWTIFLNLKYTNRVYYELVSQKKKMIAEL